MKDLVEPDVLASAIVTRRNRRLQLTRPELQLLHWQAVYIPERLVVIRPLTRKERKRRHIADKPNDVVYGAFCARTGKYFISHTDRSILVRQIKEAQLLVTWLQ